LADNVLGLNPSNFGLGNAVIDNSPDHWHGRFASLCWQTGGLFESDNAYYWSSTFQNSNFAVFLGAAANYVDPNAGDRKNLGFSVRCVRNY
jgi:uncharacterized protein (TIGR02145 family)